VSELFFQLEFVERKLLVSDSKNDVDVLKKSRCAMDLKAEPPI